MLNTSELNIILTLTDRATEGLRTFSSNISEASRNLRHLGRNISQVGSILTIFGGSITAVFSVALKNAADNVSGLQQQFDRIQNTTDNFQETIGNALLPIVTQFANILNILFNAFSSLSPALQNAIIQGTFLTGVFLTLGGGITFITGKIISLIGSLTILISNFLIFAALNPPLLVIAGTIAIIVALMFKFKWIADTVMSTFQVLFLFLKNGFLTIKMALEGFLLGVTEAIEKLFNLLGRIPGPIQDIFQILAEQARLASESIREGINQDLEGLNENIQKIGETITTGQGEWSQGFEDLRTSIANTSEEMARSDTQIQLSSNTWRNSIEGIANALGFLQTALSSAATQNRAFAIASQVIAIGMAIINTNQAATEALKVPPPWVGYGISCNDLCSWNGSCGSNCRRKIRRRN